MHWTEESTTDDPTAHIFAQHSKHAPHSTLIIQEFHKFLEHF